MRRALAVGAALLAARASAVDWTTWESCKTEEPTENATEVDPNEDVLREELREAHQIVFVNNYTGKLEVNKKARVWEELERMGVGDVSVLVLYGIHSTGRSTLATMLNCAMNQAGPNTVFPAKRRSLLSDDHPHTVGIWASDPFVYKGPDGKGEPKNYLILDTQGLDHATGFEGLSRKVQNDAAIKIVAMLTEVASEFIYVSSSRGEILGQSHFDDMGLAFKSTRENLVKSGEDFQSEADKELNIHSTNHPGLLFVTRENPTTDLVKAKDFNLDAGKWDEKSVKDFEARDQDLKTLLEGNFKSHKVTVTEAEKDTSFLYAPFPHMGEILKGDAEGQKFNWVENAHPYPLDEAEACRAYRDMSNADWTCTKGGATSKPAEPPTFKLMLDNLANEIYQHAPVREVTWGDLDKAQTLSGARLKGFMEASVTEINKAGPVADNQLWFLIMEDRCLADLDNQVEAFYTRKYDDLVQKAIPAKMGHWDEHEIARQNASFVAEWITTIELFDTIVGTFFKEEALLMSVQEECTAHAKDSMSRLNISAYRLFAEMSYLGEQAVTNRLEREKSELEKQLTKALADLEEIWWTGVFPYYVAFGLLGVAAICVVMRMFNQVTGTCKACCLCCGDLATTDTDYKVTHIVNHADGRSVEMTAGSAVAIPPSAAPMGNDDPRLAKRVNELEEVVLQLSKRIGKQPGAQAQLPGAQALLGSESSKK